MMAIGSSRGSGPGDVDDERMTTPARRRCGAENEGVRGEAREGDELCGGLGFNEASAMTIESRCGAAIMTIQ